MKSFVLAGSLAMVPTVHAESTVLFAGDIMLAEGPGQMIANGIDPLAPFGEILASADYRIGNLECPVAEKGEPWPHKPIKFLAHPRVVDTLKKHFDAVSVANNHSADYGKDAFVETLTHLRAKNIAYFGGGKNLQEAHQPHVFSVEGLKIAVLGYNEFKPRAFEAGPDWPGIAWSEDSHVVADIRAAREAGADLVIPFMHWGWEYEPHPDQRQQALAHLMIDAGADMVIGDHPHVTQGADVYKGKPILWSLGNFVFDGFSTPETQQGWLAALTIDKRGIAAVNIIESKLDKAGTPVPVTDTPQPCWKRGDNAIHQCAVSQGR